jgi:hypothetical protein
LRRTAQKAGTSNTISFTAKKASFALTDAEGGFAASKVSAARFIVLPAKFVERPVDILYQPIEDCHAVRSSRTGCRPNADEIAYSKTANTP